MSATEQPVWTGGYELPVYPFVPPPELAGGAKRRYPIVIVGGGLSGLTLGCDLANRGVAPDRMVARGYGSTMPVASNTTSAGRNRNRRVELHRID